jgi:hypothetical protein
MVELPGIHAFNSDSILHEEEIKNINEKIYDISLEPLIENSVEMRKVEQYAADIVHDMSSISVYFGLIMGLHFSDATIFYMYDNYGDLLKPKDYSNMQPDEIEAENIRIEKELLARIREDKSNPFHQIIEGGNPLKIKQLRELLCTVSLRPTISGDVIAKPINNGLIMGALKDPSDKYIDALASRIPMVVNNKDTGIIGYFIKGLNIICRTLEVSTTKLDCGSRHPVYYEIKTSKHLDRVVGKYMVEGDDLHMITKKDTRLIGQRVPIRSVITCCCGENEICATCAGEIINLNWDIAEGFATFITEEYSKSIEQNALSTKHLIHPIPEVIKWSDTFDKYFDLQGDEIYLKEELAAKGKDYEIIIDPEDIFKIDEFDNETTYNTYIDTGKFIIHNNKTGEDDEISSESNKKIFIRTELNDVLEKGRVQFKDLPEECPLFEISIENNDATKPFREIMSLIDLENKGLPDDEIETIAQRIFDLFVEAGLKLNITACEIILNRICREPGNVKMRPNFSGRKRPACHFYSLGKCIEENASPTLGMIYEQLMRQLLRYDLETRNSTSFIDPFFEEEISMESVKALQGLEDD